MYEDSLDFLCKKYKRHFTSFGIPGILSSSTLPLIRFPFCRQPPPLKERILHKEGQRTTARELPVTTDIFKNQLANVKALAFSLACRIYDVNFIIYIRRKTRKKFQVIFNLRPRWTQHPSPRWTRFGKNQELILKTHFARLLQ